MEQELAVVGVAVPRRGLADKVRGQARYTADLKRPGMLFGRVLRSPHAHARIVRIDTSEAEHLPGVQAVLTYQDVPQRRIDADLLPLEPVLRFVGDEVALVAAESEAIAEDALRGAFGDADARGDVARPRLRVACDREQDVSVVAEKHPRRPCGSGRLVHGVGIIPDRRLSRPDFAYATRVSYDRATSPVWRMRLAGREGLEEGSYERFAH